MRRALAGTGPGIRGHAYEASGYQPAAPAAATRSAATARDRERGRCKRVSAPFIYTQRIISIRSRW